MKNQAPPLTIWVITAILFILSQVAFYLYYEHVLKKDLMVINQARAKETSNFLLDHMEAKIKADQDAFQVITVGSSLVQCAIDCEDQIAMMAKLKADTKLNVFKLYTAGTGLEFLLKDVDVFDKILELQPNLLCIERVLYVRELKKEEKIFEFSFSYFGDVFRHFNSERPNRTIDVCGAVNRQSTSDTLNQFVVPGPVKSFEEESYIHPYLERFRKNGIRVVFIDIPKPAPIKTSFQNSLQKLDFDNCLKTYQKKFHIDYWQYPNELSYSYFSDDVHLNIHGRKLYSQWLVDEIIEQFDN